jgi:hypothetical protein
MTWRRFAAAERLDLVGHDPDRGVTAGFQKGGPRARRSASPVQAADSITGRPVAGAIHGLANLTV